MPVFEGEVYNPPRLLQLFALQKQPWGWGGLISKTVVIHDMEILVFGVEKEIEWCSGREGKSVKWHYCKKQITHPPPIIIEKTCKCVMNSIIEGRMNVEKFKFELEKEEDRKRFEPSTSWASV